MFSTHRHYISLHSPFFKSYIFRQVTFGEEIEIHYIQNFGGQLLFRGKRYGTLSQKLFNEPIWGQNSRSVYASNFERFYFFSADIHTTTLFITFMLLSLHT